MYTYQYPVERRVMEERLAFLEKEYNRFEYMINPYHLQPGLLLDVDITSIKRKKATLDAMGNVLSEFLQSVSKGFQDAAFASFSRRRSDTSQSFSSTGEKSREENTTQAGSDYLDLLNEDNPEVVSDSPEVKPVTVVKRNETQPKPKSGAVDGKSRRTGRNGVQGVKGG